MSAFIPPPIPKSNVIPLRRPPPRWHLAVGALVSLLTAAVVLAAFLGLCL